MKCGLLGSLLLAEWETGNQIFGSVCSANIYAYRYQNPGVLKADIELKQRGRERQRER